MPEASLCVLVGLARPAVADDTCSFMPADRWCCVDGLLQRQAILIPCQQALDYLEDCLGNGPVLLWCYTSCVDRVYMEISNPSCLGCTESGRGYMYIHGHLDCSGWPSVCHWTGCENLPCEGGTQVDISNCNPCYATICESCPPGTNCWTCNPDFYFYLDHRNCD